MGLQCVHICDRACSVCACGCKYTLCELVQILQTEFLSRLIYVFFLLCRCRTTLRCRFRSTLCWSGWRLWRNARNSLDRFCQDSALRIAIRYVDIVATGNSHSSSLVYCVWVCCLLVFKLLLVLSSYSASKPQTVNKYLYIMYLYLYR